MTQPRRDWRTTFADSAVLSDLYTAAREDMTDICEDDPSDCICPDNRMTPLEFAEWVEREVQLAAQRTQRFEPGHRPRRMKDGSMSLAIAG